MDEYKPFLIANFRSGFNEALEPWMLPRDSFQILQNGHLYRGVIDKINGYDIFTRMSYTTEAALSPVPDGSNRTFTITLPSELTSTNFTIQSAINSGMTLKETFTYQNDASSTVLNLISDGGGTGTIDISTPSAPVISVTFNTAPVSKVVGGVQYNTVLLTYDSVPSGGFKPIMGIKPYYNNNGSQDIIVFDTRRAGRVTVIGSLAIESLLSMNYAIRELPHQVQVQTATHSPAFDGTATTFTGTISGPLVPGEVSIPLYLNTGQPATTGGNPIIATDDGSGALSGHGISSGFINYTTGNWTITFSAAPASTDTINTDVCVYGDTFSGTFSNFFSVTNWQTLATENAAEADNNLLFITNNVDAIRYWNGSCLMFLNTNLSTTTAPNVTTYDISTCLFVLAYQGRLLLISVIRNGNFELNNIYWSANLDPLTFTGNEFEPAPTSEPIRTIGQINNDLLVRFARSERVFRYTQDQNGPFRWDGVNSIFPCDSSYGTINYDYYLTSLGKPAIVASDGRNVYRKDDLIPDFTDPERVPQMTPARFLDQTSIGQCYGERFDDFKEGWMCYTSDASTSDPAAVQPADSILAFNYQDETYAVYTFPFSCLGFGTVITTLVWGNDFREWGSISDTWGEYQIKNSGLLDLAGDQFGNVFQLDTAFTQGPQRTSKAITGVSNATEAVITSAGHGLVSGDQIVIQGIVSVDNGMGFLNNQAYVVDVEDANTFTIPVDTTSISAYTSGGVWFTNPVVLDLITKNFTPFAEEGQLTRLGYVDLLVSANNDTNVRVQFFKDDQLALDSNDQPTNFYLEVPLTFSQTAANSSVPQTKVWKRVYCGAVAKEHTIRIYQNLADFTSDTLDQPVRIHGMCLYMKPAGRIFN